MSTILLLLLPPLAAGTGDPSGVESAPFDVPVGAPVFQEAESPEPKEKSGWDYLVALYLFGADINGTVAGIEIETPFSDTWENLDKGGSAFFNAHNGTWGYQIDGTYMSVSNDVGPTNVEVRQNIGVLEGDLLWRIGGTSVDLLAGLRYFDISNEVKLAPPVKTSTEVLDPVIGAQWAWGFAERWKLWLRGDVGGFGLSSKFTYQALAAIDWQFAGGFSASLGYRVLGYDFDQGGLVLEDVRFQGAQLGLGYRF